MSDVSHASPTMNRKTIAPLTGLDEWKRENSKKQNDGSRREQCHRAKQRDSASY
jgi:hypothetical protein